MGKKETIYIWWAHNDTSERKILSTFIILLVNESVWEISSTIIKLNFLLMFFMFLTYWVWLNHLLTWNKTINRFSKIQLLPYKWLFIEHVYRGKSLTWDCRVVLLVGKGVYEKDLLVANISDTYWSFNKEWERAGWGEES